jgi:phosphoglucomutase
MSKYKEWLLSDYFDEDTKKELEAIKDDKQEIEDRFYKELNFGTGGLRGIIGAGTNRMNKYTVRKTTQGLANYIVNYSDDGRERGVVIAYDSRYKSPEFALEAALVLNGNGIKAYLFDELRPTPELSFAVRELKAIGGIVITASHNPPQYNGYKVYWEDGGQIVPEQAREIIAEIKEVDDLELVKIMERKEAEEKGLLKIIGEEIDTRFIEEILKVLPRKGLVKEKGKDLSIIYTPLHGTGNKLVRQLLKDLGFTKVKVVKEQAVPDPDFSTVESPNPEEFSAFTLALEIATDTEADLIIGTDPDCDRMGIVVKDSSGEYIGLTGNQVGVLMTDFLLSQLKEAGNLPANGVVIKTIVTTEMVRKIADDYNIKVLDVLTGFKFIGEKIKEFEEKGDRTFIFGFEESYGYLAGTHARDKDAVIASGLIAVMTLYYREKEGISLYEKLQQLMEKYGYYKEDLASIRLEGKEGQEKIQKTLARLREDRPEKISGTKVVIYKDYLEGKAYNYQQKTEEDIDLPESNVLQYQLEDESLITIRPSGTEPKLKIYFAIRGKTEKEASEKLRALSSRFLGEVNDILEEV